MPKNNEEQEEVPEPTPEPSQISDFEREMNESLLGRITGVDESKDE